MHVVVWTIAGERYAVDTRVVVEVIPVVEPRRIAQSPTWLAGLINYRGALIPVLDVRSLLGEGASELLRSARILVLRVRVRPETDGEKIGLLVEAVDGVGHHDFEGDGARPGLGSTEAPYLGPTALTDGVAIQLIQPEKLLRDEHHIMLFEEAGGRESDP